MLVFTLVFTNFFDAMGTMTGLSKEAGARRREGRLPAPAVGADRRGRRRRRRRLRPRASSNTVFIESGAGIGEGARTGLANIVTGLLFLVAMFFTPLVSIVPTEVAAAALVIVGALMMSQIRTSTSPSSRCCCPCSSRSPSCRSPTRSPTASARASSPGWSCARCSGKAREISPLLWIVAAGFLVYFARGPDRGAARRLTHREGPSAGGIHSITPGFPPLKPE